jgi:hypothetical protein
MSEDGGFIIGTSGNIIIKTDQDLKINTEPGSISGVRMKAILISK